MSKSTHNATDGEFTPFDITRPDPRLLQYYVIISLCTLVGFPVAMLMHWIKYVTLRYQFDDKGISMKWGFLFRREILLTYRRIQDIHVTRNIIERWLGLATVNIQTASGTSGAEMSIVGILAAEELRDFLYRQMRGARHPAGGEEGDSLDASTSSSDVGNDDEALRLLAEIRDAVRDLQHGENRLS